MKKKFIHGPVSSELITESITKHALKTDIGAHSVFLGQVRADVIDGKEVVGIEYGAYEEMADKIFHEIIEESFQKFDLRCVHIYHSLGFVKVGEISLFVFISSQHRKASFAACEWIVEQIKNKVPIYGKEIFNTNEYQWKENTP